MKKSSKLLLGLVVLVVVAGLGVFGYFKYKDMTSNENIFKKTVSEVIETLKSNTKSLTTEKVDYKLKVNVDMKGTEYKDILDIINKLEISGSCAFDKKNTKMDLVLNTKYNDKKLLDADIYLAEKKLYVYLEDIYDKYISISDDKFDINFEEDIKEKDLNQIYESAEKAINSSLKEEYFKYEKEDGYDKTTLELDDKLANELSKDVIDKLKEDEKFVESFANITDKTKNEVLTELDKAYKEIKDSDATGDEKVSISVYTKGVTKKFVKLVISSDDTTFEISKDDDKYIGVAKTKDKEVFKITVVEKDDNYTITAEVEGIKITLDLYLKVDEDAKFEDKDVSKSVSYEELSQNDLMNIMTKLSENKGFMDIMNAINSLSMF